MSEYVSLRISSRAEQTSLREGQQKVGGPSPNSQPLPCLVGCPKMCKMHITSHLRSPCTCHLNREYSKSEAPMSCIKLGNQEEGGESSTNSMMMIFRSFDLTSHHPKSFAIPGGDDQWCTSGPDLTRGWLCMEMVKTRSGVCVANAEGRA